MTSNGPKLLPMEQRPVLTLQETMAVLGIRNPRTMRQLLHRGEFPNARKLGPGEKCQWRIPKRDIARWCGDDNDPT